MMSSKITVLVLVDLLDLTDVVKGVTEARLELRLGSSIDDVHATEFHQQGYTHICWKPDNNKGKAVESEVMQKCQW